MSLMLFAHPFEQIMVRGNNCRLAILCKVLWFNTTFKVTDKCICHSQKIMFVFLLTNVELRTNARSTISWLLTAPLCLVFKSSWMSLHAQADILGILFSGRYSLRGWKNSARVAGSLIHKILEQVQPTILENCFIIVLIVLNSCLPFVPWYWNLHKIYVRKDCFLRVTQLDSAPDSDPYQLVSYQKNPKKACTGQAEQEEDKNKTDTCCTLFSKNPQNLVPKST